MRAYKIFDLGYNLADEPVPKTLFHGIRRISMRSLPPPQAQFSAERTRTLPVDTWLDAERRWVVDGSRRTPYRSGFHCYTNLDAVKAWFKRARKENRVVVMVEINDDARVKPHAVRHTLLADRMKIHNFDWATRMPAEHLEDC